MLCSSVSCWNIAFLEGFCALQEISTVRMDGCLILMSSCYTGEDVAL